MNFRVALGFLAIFCAGILTDRLLLTRSPEPVSQVAVTEKALTTSASSSVVMKTVEQGVASTTSKGSKSSTTQSGLPELKPVKPITIQKSLDEKPILSRDQEALLDEMLKNPIAVSGAEKSTKEADGGVSLYSKGDDGRDYYKRYNSQGQMIREGWKSRSSAESMNRTYYESGEPKQLFWRRADNTSTSIEFTERGVYESRFDTLIDGFISVQYDDSGRIQHIYWLDKNRNVVKQQ